MNEKKLISVNKKFLELVRKVYKRSAEIDCDEMDRDIENMDKVDVFYSSYLRAFWEKRLNANFKISDYIKKSENFDEQYKLVLEVLFPEEQETKNIFETDVAKKLEWYKRRIAKDFESKIAYMVAKNSISSAIEKLFLIEWVYNKVDEKFNVSLLTQHKVNTNKGTYTVDFSVTKIGTKSPILAIELDGHEFHEKTREQAKYDKSRERAIVSSGIPVLRFTGSEIFQNTRRCVIEISDYLSKLSLKDGKS